MVFENLTLFEVHLEDANFSPTMRNDGSNDGNEEGDDDSAEESGFPVGRMLVASVVVSVVVALLAKKLLGDDELPDVEIDAPEEPVDVSIDD